MKFTWLACAAMVAGGVAGPAAAHHSFAAFNQSKVISLTGTVKDWQWTNPHTYLMLAVAENGKVNTYTLEGGSPAIWHRRGYERNVVKPGDKVTVTIHPRVDGTPGGNVIDIIGADGRSLKSHA